jgi:hypothetical protein
MKKGDYVVRTAKDPKKLKDIEILSAELVELQKVLLVDYHEVDGVPLLIFERISDSKMVSYWVYENMEDSVLTNKKKVAKSLLKTPIWIAIWSLEGKAHARIVVGQMMRSLSELVPIAIDDPPFSRMLKGR